MDNVNLQHSPEAVQLQPERPATEEEIGNFWTPEMIHSATDGLDNAQVFVRGMGNEHPLPLKPEDIVLLMNDVDGSFSVFCNPWDTNKIYLVIPTYPDPIQAPFKVEFDPGPNAERVFTHEALHIQVTPEFRNIQNGLGVGTDEGGYSLQLIEEAVVSLTTSGLMRNKGFHEGTYVSEPKEVCKNAYRSFISICEIIADRLPEIYGNYEQKVIRDFQKWMFVPGEAHSMLEILKAAFGEDLGTLVNLTSNYVNGVLDCDIKTSQENTQKLAELNNFIELLQS